MIWDTILALPEVVRLHHGYIDALRIQQRRPAPKRRKTNTGRKRRLGRCNSAAATPLVTVQRPGVVLPAAANQCQQSIVDALATLLPLEAKLKLFGFYHPIVLLSVFYRNNNLTWIVLSRLNYKIYTSAHLIADSMHLFGSLRKTHPELLPACMKDLKFSRQGCNNQILIFAHPDHYSYNFLYVKPSAMPSFVLRWDKDSDMAWRHTRKFLRDQQSLGFMADLRRQCPPPAHFDPCPNDTLECTRGWKTFKLGDTAGCQRPQACSCADVVKALVQQIDKFESAADLASHIMAAVPSTLDKPEADDLRARFAAFAAFVQRNPTARFFPQR